MVGSRAGSNIGGSFERGARTRGWEVALADPMAAHSRFRVLRSFAHRVLRGRPLYQDAFSAAVWRQCEKFRPDVVIATGFSPVNQATLQKIRRAGHKSAVFLSDDISAQPAKTRWFTAGLGLYDVVATPRVAAIPDLRQAGARNVLRLPFGYDPDLFFPRPANHVSPETADVFFAGGADADRVPMIAAVAQAGFKLALYGSYWERYAPTRSHTRGQCDIPTLREAAWSSKVSLCCVRRANRDEHCMRTFELPALGVCQVVEDTAEHREILGPEGEGVLYFRDYGEMVEKTRRLIQDRSLRERLRLACHRRIAHGRHTYADRLETLLTFAAADRGNESPLAHAIKDAIADKQHEPRRKVPRRLNAADLTTD